MYGDAVSIADSLIISLVSMSVVFLILLAISYLIDLNAMIVRKCLSGKEKSGAKGAPAPKAVSPAPIQDSGAGDSHRQAVLAAAIAAYLGTSADQIIVRRITRTAGSDTPWGRRALQDNIR